MRYGRQEQYADLNVLEEPTRGRWLAVGIAVAAPPGVGKPVSGRVYTSLYGVGSVSSGPANILRHAITAADRLRNDLVHGKTQLHIVDLHSLPSQGNGQSAALFDTSHYGVSTLDDGHVDDIFRTIPSGKDQPEAVPAGLRWGSAVTALSWAELSPDYALYNETGNWSREGTLQLPECMEDSADPDAWDLAIAGRIWQRDLRHCELALFRLPDLDVPVRVSARPALYARLTVRFNLPPDIREQLLRLVDSIRSALRLALIRVVSALSRRPNAHCFGLALLAIARRFGHRGEPDDYVLSAFKPITVVIGEVAGSV